MRTSLIALAAALTLGTSLAVAAPAQAETDDLLTQREKLGRSGTATAVESQTVEHVGVHPGQAGISGCFMKTAPIFVTSGVNSLQVWDVSDPAQPQMAGTLPNILFENEAMNCGERQTKDGTKRFVLIGVDLVHVSEDIEHTNVGGGELIVVDVTDPDAPTIRSRTPGVTSTHTVACVDERNCRTAYSAGDSSGFFSVFDLRKLGKPVEVDSDKQKEGLQPFASPTAGHKWNFDAAGIGTHTGWEGASMWSTDSPRHPKLITTTGAAGRGEAGYEEWNTFVLHNAFRPNAKAFRPNAKPALKNGNVLLITEEDYEQTDCTQAGSFQTWHVKRLDGAKSAIVPLDKVELSDLGNYPLPQGGFCSAHWFDYRAGGMVAAGFYGGGTQILDVRDPKDIKSYGYSLWGGSEVWDAMWVPVYKDGKQTGGKTNIVYSIDLVRGLDVYEVTLPDSTGVSESKSSEATSLSSSVVPLGMVGGAVTLAVAIGRLRRRRS